MQEDTTRPDQPLVRVEIVLDVACVWSFLGYARFLRAAARHRAEGGAVEVTFRPFQVAPGASVEGEPLSELHRRDFGDEASDKERSMSALAAADGLTMDFDRAVFANTRGAHRLIALAAGQGRAEAMVERLFRAYFSDGLNVADPATLKRLAAEIGVAWRDAGAEDVRRELEQVRRSGVTSVPRFVVGRQTLVGTQSEETLLAALADAARERPEEDHLSPRPPRNEREQDMIEAQEHRARRGSEKRRTDRLDIRDPRAGAVLASVWTLPTVAAQHEAAEASLSAMPGEPGLLRYSVLRGVDDLTLFHLSLWADAAARDTYTAGANEGPKSAVDAAVPEIRRDWRDAASPYRSIVFDRESPAACLVVVRQPLRRPDPATQRSWVDTVIAALESDAEPTPGLRAASFFAASDGAHVLNLAEWADADAHRAALKPVDVGRGESIGESPQWRASRSHPGILSEHEVRRYELAGAVEFGDG